MADHIPSIFRCGCDPTGAQLVETVAALPALGPDKTKKRRFVSFASKYCHFFVDPILFPVLDSYAYSALQLHLGKRSLTVRTYADYRDAINRLRHTAGLDSTYGEMDHYLWLRGQKAAFDRDSKAAINAEASAVFANRADDHLATLINQAFGA